MHRIIVLVLFIFSGCTSNLWAPDYKHEILDGFYINPENQDLIVTTKENAYIFNIEEILEEILTLSRVMTFHPQFKKFEIDKENNVTGEITLVFVDANATEVTLEKLTELGFQNGLYNESLREISIQMSGKRFIIQGELPMEKLQENRHRIRVRQPRSFSQTAANIVASPGAVVYDSVVVAPAAIIFLVPLMIITSSM